MVKKTTLLNGLRILTIPQKNTRTVTVLVLVGTGSKYEEKRVNGISHFLEHMFFKGTKKRPTPRHISEPIESVGGMFNASTTEDWTGYFIKVGSSYTGLALDIVSDIFLNSVLPEKEIQKEKGVVVQEINMRNDSPMTHVADLWPQFLYGDQPAGWDTAGTKKSVSGLSRKDLLSYIKSQYVASNTVFCVAGNIDAKRTIENIKRSMKDISASDFNRKQKVRESQTKPGVFVEYRKTGQTHLAFGARAYNIFHKDHWVQNLLAVMLGGGMSSRLFTEIREKLGLAYYVSCHSEENPDTGYLVTVAGVKNENAEQVIRVIAKEYQKIAKQGVSSQELKKAKEQVKGRMAISLEPSESKAEFYGMQEILENRFFTPEQLYAKIDKVSTADIKRVAKDIFKPEKLNLVLLGPFKEAKPFEKLLKI